MAKKHFQENKEKKNLILHKLEFKAYQSKN
jgi:hypothetical protein